MSDGIIGTKYTSSHNPHFLKNSLTYALNALNPTISSYIVSLFNFLSYSYYFLFKLSVAGWSITRASYITYIYVDISSFRVGG